MDTLKKPEMGISLGALTVSISTGIYLNSQITKIKDELDLLNEKLALVVRKTNSINILESHITDLAKAIRELNIITSNQDRELDNVKQEEEDRNGILEQQTLAIQEMQDILKELGHPITRHIRIPRGITRKNNRYQSDDTDYDEEYTSHRKKSSSNRDGRNSRSRSRKNDPPRRGRKNKIESEDSDEDDLNSAMRSVMGH